MKQYRTLAVCAVFCLGMATMAAAQDGSAITIALGDAVANVGDTVEVPVYLTAGAAAPTVLILFIRYDPDKLAPFPEYYEFIFTDALGNPEVDENGNTITVESAVRPEPSLEAADKLVETGVLPDGVQSGFLPPGVFSIGVFGFDFEQVPIPEGKLFTIAFEVLDGAVLGETLVIEGVGMDNPVQVTGEDGQGGPIAQEAFSTASDGSAIRITVNPVDGNVVLGCTPADTPSNAAATQNRADGVLVTWAAIADQDAEYRVFRSTLADVNTAVPLGDAWQIGTEFLDITAAVPLNIGGGCGANSVVTDYYYWVKARSSGCESAFQSLGTLGFRSGGKSLRTAGARGGMLLWAAMATALALCRRPRTRKN